MTSTGIKALERTIRKPSHTGGSGGADVRLLDVATRLFMERGFDGTSIDAVAEAAGIGKPTVYARQWSPSGSKV